MSKLYEALERAQREAQSPVPEAQAMPAAVANLVQRAPVDPLAAFQAEPATAPSLREAVTPEFRPPEFRAPERPIEGPARPLKTAGMKREMAALFATLRPLIEQQKSLVVHMTAAEHGEGTSTIAHELAKYAAQQEWCDVLLLDAGGIGSMHKERLAPQSVPLIDALAAGSAIEPARMTVGGNELWIADLVTPSAGTPSLQLLRELYHTLRERFTLVIVDFPPVMSALDTPPLSETADGIVLVVQAEGTRIPVIQRAKANLEAAGCTIIGVVFNKRPNYIPKFLYRLL